MRLTLPWVRPTAEPSGHVIVQVSSLSLAQRRHIPAFLIAAIRLRRLAGRADGFAGLGLIADLSSLTFFTLSAWTDGPSLRGFVSHAAHQTTMQRFGPKMATSHFVTWTSVDSSNPTEYPPRWDDALRRVSELRKGQ